MKKLYHFITKTEDQFVHWSQHRGLGGIITCQINNDKDYEVLLMYVLIQVDTDKKVFGNDRVVFIDGVQSIDPTNEVLPIVELELL